MATSGYNRRDILAWAAATWAKGSDPDAGSPQGERHRTHPQTTALRTSGASIIDAAAGLPVRLHGVGWWDGTSEPCVLHGLEAVNWQQTMRDMVRLGFNSVRLHNTVRGVLKGGMPMSGVDYRLNPDLRGLNSLQVYDRICAYAKQIGLGVIMDMHNTGCGTSSGFTSEGRGWVDSYANEADYIQAWQQLASRYHGLLQGCDLMNEPWSNWPKRTHMTWGDGGPHDLQALYQRLGNAILAIDPDPLILCACPTQASNRRFDGSSGPVTGGDATGVRQAPVVLSVPDKICYVVHQYPRPWAPFATTAEVMNVNWGFLVADDIAPICITECGTNLSTADGPNYASAFVPYINGGSPNGPKKPMHAWWWCWLAGFGGEPNCSILTAYNSPDFVPTCKDWIRRFNTASVA
jgi:endoglucanase